MKVFYCDYLTMITRYGSPVALCHFRSRVITTVFFFFFFLILFHTNTKRSKKTCFLRMMTNSPRKKKWIGTKEDRRVSWSRGFNLFLFYWISICSITRFSTIARKRRSSEDHQESQSIPKNHNVNWFVIFFCQNSIELIDRKAGCKWLHLIFKLKSVLTSDFMNKFRIHLEFIQSIVIDSSKAAFRLNYFYKSATLSSSSLEDWYQMIALIKNMKQELCRAGYELHFDYATRPITTLNQVDWFHLS